MYKNINSKPYSVHKFSNQKRNRARHKTSDDERNGAGAGARARENGVKSHKLLYMTAK